jgi:hypothetical protein
MKCWRILSDSEAKLKWECDNPIKRKMKMTWSSISTKQIIEGKNWRQKI